MDVNEEFENPDLSKVALWYLIGLLFGGLIALPALRSALGLVSLGDTGPIGRVLLVGVLSILAVAIGLVGLYQL